MRARRRAAGCTGRRSSADILYPEHPTDPAEVLANISTAKDASAALDGYNPPHKLYKELKAKLAELRGQGDGPVDADRRRPGADVQGRRPRSSAASRAGRSARAAAARQARHHRESPTTRITTPRSPTPCANSRRAPISRPTGVLDDRTVKAHQQPEARPPDRHRHRQHGALALAAARTRRAVARQRLCHSQHPGLHAQGDAERRARSGPPAW